LPLVSQVKKRKDGQIPEGHVVYVAEQLLSRGMEAGPFGRGCRSLGLWVLEDWNTEDNMVPGNTGELLWVPACQSCLAKFEPGQDAVSAEALCMATMEATDGTPKPKKQEEEGSYDKSHLRSPLTANVEAILKMDPRSGSSRHGRVRHASKVVAKLMQKMDLPAIEHLLCSEVDLKDETEKAFASLQEASSLVHFLRGLNMSEPGGAAMPQAPMLERTEGDNAAMARINEAERLALGIRMLTKESEFGGSQAAHETNAMQYAATLMRQTRGVPSGAFEEPAVLSMVLEDANLTETSNRGYWNMYVEEMQSSLFGSCAIQDRDVDDPSCDDDDDDYSCDDDDDGSEDWPMHLGEWGQVWF